MKVLITENQLEKLIEKYIAKLFRNIHQHNNDEYGIIYWENENDELILELNSDGFYVNHDIWEEIKNVFNLSEAKTRKVIKQWVERNLNVGKVFPIQDYNPEDFNSDDE